MDVTVEPGSDNGVGLPRIHVYGDYRVTHRNTFFLVCLGILGVSPEVFLGEWESEPQRLARIVVHDRGACIDGFAVAPHYASITAIMECPRGSVGVQAEPPTLAFLTHLPIRVHSTLRLKVRISRSTTRYSFVEAGSERVEWYGRPSP
ncbi:hypothetical protein B9Q06_11785 [Candidatus Marsarchaeota G2 archaeon ECH_B_2]|uniref:Uncharacterized protein n=3 Tax=Candidatus Marsarchaeota group 2 TaxID=2203771 RepID=A0A2R6B4G8_9ARCH|nr:MAG: hypothetical protein B9Q06_11785 [Candidatus Marsarchaeota G2 archaeon ECH_B_2]PSN97918.1 MAG: hypothetical protein B9Q07_11120 [Candidatus Marsarchaeota G2 archaeon ECH_B_3]PSN99474.1 MAG: hypothetical protein B9Q05_11735 [Candidatus Marsarchaeota G2 archaeon ECH_B_1]